MADNNKKQYIKYEDAIYTLEDHRLPDPTGFDNKVLGVDNGAYVIRDEQGGGGGTGTVKSVNNVQPDANGNVNLSASDVHALPDSTVIPTVPQMATDPDMTDWESGKTVDAAVLATDMGLVSRALTAKYTKPSGGIPASDLASAVQTSLGKADTALQSHQDISGKADKANVYTKTEVDQKLVGAMDYKGTKATVSALPTSGNETGDVWHITADGSEWAWNGSAWEELGTAVDLSGYATEQWVENKGYLTQHQSLAAYRTSAAQDTIDAGKLGVSENAYRSASIPMGELDSTSTATVMTATVPGITELRDGVCMWLRNGVITSASGFTLNVNGLGAKPCYSSLAAESRSTTIFNVNYTMLMIYNSTRVDGGCWDIVYGVDTNTTYTPVKLGFGYGTCTTAAATAAKTASISSYALTTGGIVSIKFTNDVPANATLNITSKGAKAIYHRGAAITAGVIKAGDTATFIYSTYYHLIAIDRQYLTLDDLPLYNGGVS